jgi:hypothetical protein
VCWKVRQMRKPKREYAAIHPDARELWASIATLQLPQIPLTMPFLFAFPDLQEYD